MRRYASAGIAVRATALLFPDIDALFGTAKEHLKNLDISTPQELKAEIAKAFASYQLPVVILEVDATFDYKSYYEGHIDEKLSGYGCAA